MTTRASDLSPGEIASAVNLMAHPAAGAMALSAVGIGMASQAVGAWMGAMSAAAEFSQRFWQPMLTGDLERADKAPVAEFAVVSANAQKTERAMPAVKPARPEKTKLSPTVIAPVKIARPARPDDLKAISGVGPKLEQVLNGLGVWTYAQIAAWTEGDVAWVDEFLGFNGRISRDGWIGQAAVLAAISVDPSGAEG